MARRRHEAPTPDLTTGSARVSFPTALLYLVSGAAALFGFYRTRLRGVLGAGTGFLLVAGSALLFYVTAVLAYRIGMRALRRRSGSQIPAAASRSCPDAPGRRSASPA